jgi:hypothetical protein
MESVKLSFSIVNILGLVEEKVEIKSIEYSRSRHTNRARRARTNFSTESIAYLEEVFKTNQYPDINERERLAKMADTTESRIQVWFQNKRSRSKKINRQSNKIQKINESTDDIFSNSSSSSPQSPVSI